MKRIFLIVLDSFGIGEMPDAADYGDKGTNTLRSVSASACFHMPNMAKLGLFNIDGVDIAMKEEHPAAVTARMKEASKGKDTTIGHWEIAGIISEKPLPVYPDGFPKEIPVETLYEYCRMARKLLQGEHGVGRVIARPFVGESGNYTRTAKRHDFSLEPPGVTMLEQLSAAGRDVISIGKIQDIFVGKGITEYTYTKGNEEGIEKTLAYLEKDFEGLCFVNLVDYDMLYGHRNDIDGYAGALAYFDEKLPEIIGKMKEEDILMITADHGCDPGYTVSTDHSREYTPFLMYGKNVAPENLGTRDTFADIGATVLYYFGITPEFKGQSMLPRA
ncbi:MAG: phosphopentomutase [Lachnospiraceae bacterium]|nr:phosphopentomutase [Lachnospiraceae bacterium]